VVSYIYAFSALGLATFIQQWRHYPPEFTRKLVHIAAGMWVFGLIGLFDTWYWGIVPTATFIVLNYISYKFQLIKAMDLSDSSPGTVYFAAVITLLLAIFWPRGQVWIAVAGIMAMTWGDAFAAIVGRAFGKHPYFIGKHQRSFEGSAAMFGFGGIAILLTLALMNTGLDAVQIVSFSVFLALAATFVEAISLRGLDNVFVPIGSSMLLFVLVSWPAPIGRIWSGLLLSLIIGVFAYSRKSLTLSGVFGAIITGTLIFGFGGWVWGLTLIAFFVYGTVLSKFKERQKLKVAADKFEKGSQRDIGQALANGGVGAILAVAFFLSNGPLWLFAFFVGVMATVNADTWATEIGVLNKAAPRMITNFKVVTPGTSGGISALGTGAATVGGLAIGLTVWLLIAVRGLLVGGGWSAATFWWVIPAGLVGGLVGTMADSLLGATVQAMYFNVAQNKETEKRLAGNGEKNKFLRGFSFMDNDSVNLLSSLVGGAVALLIFWIVAG
jgi:uncharacterized protein (TIGR00297 family)